MNTPDDGGCVEKGMWSLGWLKEKARRPKTERAMKANRQGRSMPPRLSAAAVIVLAKALDFISSVEILLAATASWLKN